jgi:hypothetical protein
LTKEIAIGPLVDDHYLPHFYELFPERAYRKDREFERKLPRQAQNISTFAAIV